MEKSKAQMVAAAGMLAICSLAMGVRIIARKQNRTKKRSYWVKPWREERQRCGNIQTLLNEFKLSKDLKSYKSYLLMDELCFEELLSYIEEDITRRDTSMRQCIPAKERLAATLRFLATGENFNELNENTKLSPTFLRKNIIEVCEVICKNMEDKYLKFPGSKENWLEIAEGFESLWQFPHCLGALGSKHIKFTPTKEDNYNGLSSIVLLAMCDANCRFTFVDIDCNDSSSDSEVLMGSDLMSILNQGESVFPKPDLIGNNRIAPYVILAHNKFPNMTNLITPYSTIAVDKIINFNSRVNRARQNIERAFEVLASRFRIIQSKIKLNADKTTKIVQCCCVLHNFLIEKSRWYRENMNDAANLNGLNFQEDIDEAQKFKLQSEIENIRKTFVEYFANEGNLNI